MPNGVHYGDDLLRDGAIVAGAVTRSPMTSLLSHATSASIGTIYGNKALAWASVSLSMRYFGCAGVTGECAVREPHIRASFPNNERHNRWNSKHLKSCTQISHQGVLQSSVNFPFFAACNRIEIKLGWIMESNKSSRFLLSRKGNYKTFGKENMIMLIQYKLVQRHLKNVGMLFDLTNVQYHRCLNQLRHSFSQQNKLRVLYNAWVTEEVASSSRACRSSFRCCFLCVAWHLQHDQVHFHADCGRDCSQCAHRRAERSHRKPSTMQSTISML